MDPVLLARIQFAMTVGFHFLFPPLTIGLAWIIFWLLVRARQTGDEAYRHAAKLWTKLFAISFVVGVASGIVNEFQFGTNWAQYSRMVGDIFGAPLAIEAIFTFFLESSFLAVLVLGWDRVSRGVQLLASGLVALGATLSAFWILVANSWMQTPAGFVLRNGRAELTDFWAAVFNPSTLPRFFHTLDGAFITAALFVLGISAWMMLRGRQDAPVRISLALGIVLALFAGLAQLGLGHWHAVQVAHTQPEKLAAFEGHFNTQAYAPALLFGLPDPETATVRYAVRIPGGLSWLAYGRPDAVVQGLDAFPRAEWPPIALTFYSFHLMVLLGLYFIALPGLGLLLMWRATLWSIFPRACCTLRIPAPSPNALQGRWFRPYLWVALGSIPLPFLANELGWITAEVGRQPWIVYRVMKTADAVSISVPASQILISLGMLALIYAFLLVVWIVVLRREVLSQPDAPHQPSAGMEVTP